MDKFVLKLEVDVTDLPSWDIKLWPSREKSAEERFWDRFKSQAPNSTTGTIIQIHARIRKELPERLKREITPRLVKQLPSAVGATAQEIVDAMARELKDEPASKAGVASKPTPESSPDPKAVQTLQAIADLEFQIIDIRGGSLEVLLLAFGLSKLLSLANLSVSDFTNVLQIAGPIAMNAVFGADVQFKSDAIPVPNQTTQPFAGNGERMTPFSLGQQPPGTSYVFPALFALAFFAGAAWFLSMIAEKAAVTLSNHDKELAAERTEFAKKSNELLVEMTKSLAARDTSQVAHSQSLVTAIMDFNKKVDGDRATRDAVVWEFLKARLDGDTKPKPPVSVAAKQACDDLTKSRWVQLALKERGLYTGNIDGKLGKQSEAALMMFQYRSSLAPNHIVDAATLDKLGVNCLMASAAN